MEYCTLDELKTYLWITDISQNNNLSSLIKTLTSIIDIEIWWNLWIQTIERRVSGNGSNRIILEWWINTVNFVYLYNSYIWDDYTQINVNFIDWHIIYVDRNLQKWNKNIKISYTRWYASVPDDLKRFFLYYCKEIIDIENGKNLVSNKKIEWLSVSYFSPGELNEVTKDKKFMDLSAILKKYKNFTFWF